ncbi:MAG: hypothetical protein K0B05_00840 [Bacteroidales bacterium]|nr:hypothetical protein [Bacteroidales bacterium]
MKSGKYMASFFLLTILFIFSCQTSGTGGDKNPESIVRTYNPLGYDLNNPDRIIHLPGTLREISGITEIDSSTLACIQDENGILFLFDLTAGRIKHQSFFANPGDYEGIARIHKRIFVLRSDGTIFEIPDYEAPVTGVVSYPSGIPAADNEGFCYDNENKRLLIAPKSKIKGEKESKRAIYAFNPDTKKLASKPAIEFKLKEIQEFAIRNNVDLPLTKKKEKPKIELKPSAIAIHPMTRQLYLLSGVEKLLLVFNMEGKVEYIEKLDSKLFKQPEGITFLPNGDMIISNEGQSGQANLLIFRYQGE